MRNLANAVQSQGRGNDTMLVHMTPKEVGGLQALAKANGGSLTINPQTGLPEAGFLDSLLPTILGVGLTMMGVPAWAAGVGVGGAETIRSGDLGKGLMAGLGAFGGANLAGAFSNMGATNAANAALLDQGSASALLPPGGTTESTVRAIMGPSNTLSNTLAKNDLMAQLAKDAASFSSSPNLVPAGASLSSNAAPSFSNVISSAREPVAGMFGQNVTLAMPQNMVQAGLPETVTALSPDSISAITGAQPVTFENIGRGIGDLFTKGGPSRFMTALDTVNPSTAGKTLSALGVGAPLLEQMGPQPLELPEEEASSYAGPYLPTKRTVTYPGAGRRATSEFSYFSPSNPIPYARGGDVSMEDGGFVVDARTVSEIGNGSSNAGLERLSRLGARPIQGRGDGVSDSIPANIGGSQEARVARDEAYLPPEAVKRAGGATKLYAMMDKAHKARKSAKRGQDTGGLKALMA